MHEVEELGAKKGRRAGGESGWEGPGAAGLHQAILPQLELLRGRPRSRSQAHIL